MLKLIILNSNLENVKNICNNIISKILEIQLLGITTSIEEFLSIYDKVKPNIIMMNHSDFLNNKYCINSKHKKLKILFCDTNINHKNSQNTLYISKDSNLIQVQNSINNFILKENTRIIQKKIESLLNLFHFDFKLTGTNFLLESILFCYENKQYYVFENLERKVYPEIAKLFHTCPYHVKCTISHSVKQANLSLSPNTRKELCKNFHLDFTDKITPKQLVTTILYNI